MKQTTQTIQNTSRYILPTGYVKGNTREARFQKLQESRSKITTDFSDVTTEEIVRACKEA